MQKKKKAGEREMSFLDHLEELRWHLIRSLASIVVFTIVVFLSKDIVFNVIILGPSKPDFWTYRKLCQLSEITGFDSLCIDSLPFTLQSRKMAGQFLMHITSSFVIGLIMAFPYTFWEIWRFIRPGLYEKERKVTRGVTFSVTLLFMTGILFGYFILSPISINFLSNYSLGNIVNEFDIISYVGTLTTLVLACGLLFQLPILVYFLTKASLISPTLMRKYRKHAIVVILILGAMLTPPDPFSQLLIALPLIGLYQFSIILCNRVYQENLME